MNTSSWKKKFASVAFCAVTFALAGAQGWDNECIDPENMMPRSPDYFVTGIGNDLFAIAIGVSGTATYGGDAGPCYAPARTLNASGRIGFQVGPTGTAQTGFDDLLCLTTGMPIDACGDFGYALIQKVDNAGVGSTLLFGEGGLAGIYTGASRRYMVCRWVAGGDVDVELTVRIIGDACRLQWIIRNVSADQQSLGLNFGMYMGMQTFFGQTDDTGSNQANSLLSTLTRRPKLTPDNYIGFTVLPNTKPARNERNYMRTNPNFPNYVDFLFGQTQPWGLRVLNDATDYTTGATAVDQFLIGNHGNFQQPGLLWNNVMRYRVFTDFGTGDPLLTPGADTPQQEADVLLNETCFIQRYRPLPVAAGSARTIIQWVKAPWSNADYKDPYTALVDAPRLVATDLADTNQLSPNPMQIIAYVDNQLSTLDKELALNEVRCTLDLPPSMRIVADPGSGIVAPKTQIIPVVGPNQIQNVVWWVEADGDAFGPQDYSVRIEPVPGPAKTLKGKVLIAATPRLELVAGPNLVAIPWNFADSSLESILGLRQGQDFIAYVWESSTNQYVPVSSAQRGIGTWIIPTNDEGFVQLNAPSIPVDTASGGLLINLEHGWKMIGNPYSYAVPLGQLIGFAEDSPADTLTWSDMVTSGLVGSSLAYYDRNSGTYKYTTGIDDMLQPNTGYWIYVNTFRPIRLSWPPVLLPGLPNSGRALKEDTWKQTEKQWRLQLSARSNDGSDLENYVGVAASSNEAKKLNLPKPPAVPSRSVDGKVIATAPVELSIVDTIDGKSLRMSRSFADRNAKRDWRVTVSSAKAGDVTITWPNVTSINRSVRFRLTDLATNIGTDLRAASGYTVRFNEAGTREFKLEMIPGGITRAVIGNVVVTRPSRDKSAPFTISYNLSTAASTSIRILSGSGKEVFAVTRGRADREGSNTATWLLRDNANRAVAPGTYRVEIVAETVNGERVRSIVPINVVR